MPRIAFLVAVTATFAVTASAASAQMPVFSQMPAFGQMPVIPTGWGGGTTALAGPCGTSTGAHGQGGVAGTTTQVCTGSGLTFVGPAIGQIATVIGPTIIGPAVVNNLVVSAGNGVAGGVAAGG